MLLLVALILPVYTASVSASKENFVKEKVLRVDISTERKHEFRRRLLMDGDNPAPPAGADTGGTGGPPAGIGGGMPVGGDNEETGQGIDTCAEKESEALCTSPCNWGITTDGYGGCSSTASTDACSGKPYAECTAENSGCTRTDHNTSTSLDKPEIHKIKLENIERENNHDIALKSGPLV